MTFEFDAERSRDAYLADDRDFADWYVDEFMPDMIPEHLDLRDPEDLKKQVISGRSIARHFGIDTTEAQFEFVTLMWNLGPCFWKYPGFVDIATDPALSPADKIDAFYKIDEELAVDVIVDNNRSCWFDTDLPPMKG